MKIIRKSFFWWAILSMTLASVGGCASSGQQAGMASDFSEFPWEPTAESLVRLPEKSDVAVELKTGELLTGVFLKLSAGATALDLSVNEESSYLAPEFLEDDLLYRIPLDSIKTIAGVGNDADTQPMNPLAVIGLIMMALVVAASLGAFHVGYN